MSTIVCAISGQAALEPVFSPKTGHVYEKGLIEKQIENSGKCPVTKEDLTKDDLVPVKGNKSVRPRPATATSVPGMLTLLQSEWDAIMSETFELKSQLDTARKQLSHALYQHDAACRVIARLIRERDMVKAQNQQLQDQLANSSPLPGGAVRQEAEMGVTPQMLQNMQALADSLSKTRKQKHFPELTPLVDIKKFSCAGSHPIHKSTEPGILCVDVHKTDGKRVATGGVDAQVVLVDAEKGTMVQKCTGHSKKVTAVKLHATEDVVVSASQDMTAKVWKCSGGDWTSAYSCTHTVRKHQAEVADVSIHPTGDYFLTCALDKSWAFHDLATGRCVKQFHGESSYPCMKWHPDGMILAAGTQANVVEVWDIKEQKVVASLPGHEGSVEAWKRVSECTSRVAPEP
ncbi:unnamed protein product [Effrenium voratum]|uniref:Pre-mRNA-processing factor 19 n=1 Tax=Effrenium voratum TaxID=2562239 RepID=A0AA36J3H2_9DINO|nr:unnamed protein product [Effrenium voratum]CAJ1450673.1 unnamed protein product [Effrenium voratum]